MKTLDKSLDRERLELDTQSIGRELFEESRREKDSLFESDTWTARLLNWSTRNEDARLRLFRFVDVLPTLASDKAVVEHLREYFRGRPDPFSGLLKVGLGLASAGGLAQRAVAATLKRGLEQVARTFIAASNPEEAVRRVRQMRERSQAFTLDVLGEATLSDLEADAYKARYLDLLEVLTAESQSWDPVPQIDAAPWGELPTVNLSVKLTALNPYFDPAAPGASIGKTMERLLPIAAAAREKHAYIHVDVEEYALRDLTFATFQALCTQPSLADYRHLGIVVQAYLKDSYAHAERVVAWARERGTPITVRLVKGAYWDYETVHARLEGWPIPVYTDKDETDANFERITELLLSYHDVIDLAIGSHNIRSIARALAVQRHLGLPQGSLEFQFLYGMATSLRDALTRMGERVRIYTPYGELIPGMAYLVRRLLENTSQHSFLRRGMEEDRPVSELLRNPAHGDPAHEPTNQPNSSQTLQHGKGIGRNGTAIGRDGVANGRGIDARSDAQRSSDSLFRLAPSLGDGGFANQPHLDFSLAEHREKMQEAIESLKARGLGRPYSLHIGDRAIQTAQRLPSLNPSEPDMVIGEVCQAGVAEAEQAVEAAERAFADWGERSPDERAEILMKAADLMEARRYELAAWMILEAGKPWREADGDVAEAIDFLRYYARQALETCSLARMGAHEGEVNYYQREPLGVAAVIAPWNFPLAILTGMTSAALATGNTVILKPAEPTPVIAYRLYEILREAGVPAGAVNYLPGPGRSAGSVLVEHPSVRLIAFTGSKSVGLSILEKASVVPKGQRHIKRVIAEMGGKNAIIVDDDADLDEAVRGVVISAFGFAGQKCSACSRAIVLESIYDAFVERLVEAARSFPYGPAELPQNLMGPVISKEAQEKILGYIEQGKQEGKPLLVQEIPESLARSGGYYVPPTVFGDVPNEAVIACEEIFGPVLSCMRAATFEAALDLAMDSDYALTGGVFSRNPAHVRMARERFRVGNLYINRKTTGALVGRQPFGGLRLSGYGFKAGGPDYLLQFTEARTVTENTLRRGFASEDLTTT